MKIRDGGMEASGCRCPTCEPANENAPASSDNVTYLSEVKQEEPDLTPDQLLADALKARGTDPDGTLSAAPKMIIIALNEPDGSYDTAFRFAGLRYSECIALLEIIKDKLLRDMSFKE